MRIVMLGKLRSGKSTVADMLIEEVKERMNITLVKKPLAAPIYAEAKALYEKHGLVWRKNRRLMEGIGEALNNDYPNGDKIVELYDKDFNPDEHIIVEDARRLTQTAYFKEKQAWFIKVISSPETRKSRCKPGEWAEGHVTDCELDDYPADFSIDNDKTSLYDLRENVREIIKQIEYRVAWK